MISDRRVVVTGLGAFSPYGAGVKQNWESVLNGKSAISKVERFSTDNYRCKVAGEIKNFKLEDYFDVDKLKIARKLDIYSHYALIAVEEAVKHSGLEVKSDPHEIGVIIGSGIGGIKTHTDNSLSFHERGNKRVSPFYVPSLIGNMASGLSSILLGSKGPCFSVQSACATSNHALGLGFLYIKSGLSKAMVVGGTEATVDRIALAAFDNMKALSSKRNDTPELASRPFDADRDGFVMSEGSGVLVLEDYEYAKARGANILCEIIGSIDNSDAYDIVSPSGEGAYLCMKRLLDFCKVHGQQIDYINSHGTSTSVGDVAEAKAIKKLIGEDESNLTVGSTKSMTGHMLGAISAIEAIFCVNSIIEGKIPPTINLDNLEPEVPLKCINKEVVEKDVNIALSNSFGFGGHNTSVLFKKI